MLQKESYTLNSDTSNLRKLKIFHVYKQGRGKRGTIGFFTFSSVKAYRFFDTTRDKKQKRKRKTRGCIIRTRYITTTHDKQTLKASNNFSTVFLPSHFRSSIYIKGPLPYNIKRAKYILRTNTIL